jgi:hypothetical protein
MTSDQKIANIEAQITACQQGRTNAITCPYCNKQNVEGNPLCCNTFARAVAAILLRKDMRAKAEHAERILEKVQSN